MGDLGDRLAAEVHPEGRGADSGLAELEILLRSELTRGSERGPGETPLPINISDNRDSVTPDPSLNPTRHLHLYRILTQPSTLSSLSSSCE